MFDHCLVLALQRGCWTTDRITYVPQRDYLIEVSKFIEPFLQPERIRSGHIMQLSFDASVGDAEISTMG
jgi:hypothetical protein